MATEPDNGRLAIRRRQLVGCCNAGGDSVARELSLLTQVARPGAGLPGLPPGKGQALDEVESGPAVVDTTLDHALPGIVRKNG